MAEPYADALRSMRRIYLDAGRQDEFFLDLGAQAFSDELTRLDIPHTLELFDGKHGGISYRYPGAIRQLVLAPARPVTATARHRSRLCRARRAGRDGPRGGRISARAGRALPAPDRGA